MYTPRVLDPSATLHSAEYNSITVAVGRMFLNTLLALFNFELMPVHEEMKAQSVTNERMNLRIISLPLLFI